MEKRRVTRSVEQSFVVRISAETWRLDADRWRATIVHVPTGERRYVTSYGELCGFIESRRRRGRNGAE